MQKTKIFLRIRNLRHNAGYTQENVSHFLHIQRTTYTNYENGSRTPPLDILISLAELYQVSVDYLVRGVDTPYLSAAAKKFLVEFNSLPAPDQQEVFHFILFKKMFHK